MRCRLALLLISLSTYGNAIEISSHPSVEVGTGYTDNVNQVTPGRGGAFLMARPGVALESPVGDSVVTSVDLQALVKRFPSGELGELGNRHDLGAMAEAIYAHDSEWDAGLNFSLDFHEGYIPVYTTITDHPVVTVAPTGAQREAYWQPALSAFLGYEPSPWAFELGAGIRMRRYSTTMVDIYANRFEDDFNEPRLEARAALAITPMIKASLRSTIEQREYSRRPAPDVFGLAVPASQAQSILRLRVHSHTLTADWQVSTLTLISSVTLTVQKDLIVGGEDFTGLKLNQGIRFPSLFGVTPDTTLGFTGRDYASFRGENANSPQTQPTRTDRLIEAVFRLSYPLGEAFNLVGSYGYQKNTSNYYGQDYVQNVGQLLVDARF